MARNASTGALGLSGPALTGIIVAIAAIVGIGVYQYVERNKPPQQQAAVSDAKPEAKPGAEPAKPAGEAAAPSAGTSAELIAPSFDVFRVQPDGSVVAAGRATAGSSVDLMVDGNVAASAETSAGGEWAIVPDQPLAPGTHDVGLVSRRGEESVASAGSLSVVVDGKSTPLVALVEPGKPQQVLQQPETQVAQAETPAPQQGQEQEAAKPAETPAATPAEKPAEAPAAIAEAEKPAEKPAESAPAPSQATEAPAAAPAASEQPAAKPEVRIAGVEVEGDDRLFVTGTAPQGGVVRVYLNDEAVGDARAGIGGRFALTVERPLDPGRYTVRADLIDDAGAVTARAEVKFDRVRIAEAKPQAPAAAEPSGTGGQASAEPSSGQPQPSASPAPATGGQQQTAANEPAATSQPATSEPAPSGGASSAPAASSGASSGSAQPAPSAGSAPSASPAMPAAEPTPAAEAIPDLEIARGDNLWTIARRIYGRGIRYSVIYDANRGQIRDPDLIYPGQVFTIPVIEDENDK
ncbi:MAG: LysM peptidoglycan-binding domain-containing protein [Flavobacteriaceae bacterium]